MMYEIIPNEKREELDKALREENVGFDAKMEEVRFNIFKKNYNKALALLEEMIDQYDGVGMFEDDSVSEYYCFKEPMEEVIYRQYHPSDKTLRHSPISYVDMYLEYGALLVELNRINEAADALCKARSWNPSNAKIKYVVLPLLIIAIIVIIMVSVIKAKQ